MSYELEFDPRAWKEWNRLDRTIKEQFKEKLAEVIQNPRIESNRLRELSDCYRIKLRRSGYRLVSRGATKINIKISLVRLFSALRVLQGAYRRLALSHSPL